MSDTKQENTHKKISNSLLDKLFDGLPVKYAVLFLVALFFLFIFPQYSITLIAEATYYVINNFGLGFILFSSFTIIVSILLICSPIGSIKLGGKDSKPEFTTSSWLAMLFTAGMGSGLIFWGVAEPVFHYGNLPVYATPDGDSINNALALTYFHWGIHAWCIYALAGLSIAWFAFNRGKRFDISSSFETSNRSFKWLDWLAVVAILFGVAGTVANTIALVQTGAEQTISPNIGSIAFRISVVLIVACLFVGSSMLGLQRGIKRLSQFNMIFMLALVSIVIFSFDYQHVLTTMWVSCKNYLQLLPKVSFSISSESRQWSIDWSVIYIVWWVAWAPFVGPFLARISCGRTVRQFLLGVALVPTFASILWFSAFGGEALSQFFSADIIQAVNADYTQGLFMFFSHINFGNLLSICALLLLITFIITSADSAILVCAMLSGRESHARKLLWSVVLVALSIALIVFNDVNLNKQVAIAGAVPFTLVLSVQIILMLKDMWIVRRPENAGTKKV